MNSVRLPRLRRDLQVKKHDPHDPHDPHRRKCVSCVPLWLYGTHGTHLRLCVSCGHVCHDFQIEVARQTWKSYTIHTVIIYSIYIFKRPIHLMTHTTHGQPALVLPALVLRGQRPAASQPCALAAPRPGWQGRAVRATATERPQTKFFMI